MAWKASGGTSLSDELESFLKIVVGTGIAVMISAMVFLTFLICWLSAIRTRRKCQVKAGDLFNR